MTDSQALVDLEVMRELAYRARADRRTVEAVLAGKTTERKSGARARVLAAMVALGIEQAPAGSRLASVPPADKAAL